MKGVMLINADLSVDDYTINSKIIDKPMVMTTDVSIGGGNEGTNDYRKLKHKPTINGEELYDNYNEIDPTVPTWAKNPTKPSYTPEELGLDHDEIKYHEIDNWFKAVFNLD